MNVFILLLGLLLITGCNTAVSNVPTTTSTSTTLGTSTSTSSTSLTTSTLGTSTSTSLSTSTTTTTTTTTTVGCYIGAYVNGLSNTLTFENNINKNLAINHWYISWSTAFPETDCDTAKSYGAVPMLSWEPSLSITNTLDAISSGTYDTYITQFAQAAKAWDNLIYLRFGHEMNGNWYPWDGTHNGGSSGPAKYISAWQHIHDIFTSNGATNVKWVWAVNHTSTPNENWNSFESYYPGSGYVDYVGIDGYNWAQGNWQTFDQVFYTAYITLEALNKPIMISEFSCATDEVYSKADWITNAFVKIRSDYTLVKAALWLNEKKERDWRIESSADPTTAFKNAVSDSYFSGNKPEN